MIHSVIESNQKVSISCLEKEKTLFAKENMPKLVNKLRLVAANAQFNDTYVKNRLEIGKV